MVETRGWEALGGHGDPLCHLCRQLTPIDGDSQQRNTNQKIVSKKCGYLFLFRHQPQIPYQSSRSAFQGKIREREVPLSCGRKGVLLRSTCVQCVWPNIYIRTHLTKFLVPTLPDLIVFIILAFDADVVQVSSTAYWLFERSSIISGLCRHGKTCPGSQGADYDFQPCALYFGKCAIIVVSAAGPKSQEVHNYLEKQHKKTGNSNPETFDLDSLVEVTYISNGMG